jgi:hypothetical protein
MPYCQSVANTPDPLEAAREALRQISAQSAKQMEAIVKAGDLTPRFEVFSRLAADALRAWLPALAKLRQSWEEARPRNWADLELDSIMTVVDLMEDTGYCFVWTPRAAIVQAVLDADGPDRPNVLLAHRDDVLDDLATLLSEVTQPELAAQRLAVEQGIAAFRAGLFMPAQAMAAVVFTHYIAAHLRFRTKTALHLFKDRDPKDATIYEFRLRAIYAAAAKALARYNPVTNTPVQSDFNRHSTLHRVMPEQYTDLNALVGLMLVVPLLREVDYWLRKQAEAAGESAA